jgi:hypothetical protein
VKICPLEQRPNGSTEKVKYLVLLPNCHENPKKVDDVHGYLYDDTLI